MSLDDLDPDILAEFITESTELVEAMDQDLVTLESEPENLDLLNGIFRALHTIKGSASFLALDNLTSFAHAAEDALNELRKGNVKVSSEIMDCLLAAADVTRAQIEEMQQGEMPSAGPEDLRLKLLAIKEGKSAANAPSAADSQAETDTSSTEETESADKLQLDQSKLDLLPFMVDDLLESVETIRDKIEDIMTSDNPKGLGTLIDDTTDDMIRTADFFEITALLDEVKTCNAFGKRMAEDPLSGEALEQTTARINALLNMIERWGASLKEERLIFPEQDTLLKRLGMLLNGETLADDAKVARNAEPDEVFTTDQVSFIDINAPAQSEPSKEAETSTGITPVQADTQSEQPKNTAMAPADNEVKPENKGATAGKAKAAPTAEQTIRVDVERLEALLNLVGELVLQKNRVLAMVKTISRDTDIDQDRLEEYGQIASDLDRVTGDLQMGVMKTRLQPLSKLFSRYPRVIRDLSRATEKEIDLVIEGGETEVDKSVLEGLGDPMVHILRNSCDHGIEKPDVRVANGKSSNGTLKIAAAHAGSHVHIMIKDDGAGIDPTKVGPKAVEKGVLTQEELDNMTDQQIIQLIFAPGFSTAAKVSGLSGRGVGMDVVKSNIVKLNGMIDLQSEVGVGTTLTIKIPLTVAIMQAMMVKVCGELYAIPLSNILEIVQPDEQEVSTVSGSPVMRLRDQVVPLLELQEVFSCPNKDEPKFAVIVGLGDQRVGLMVSQLIGQQEVVIKPLDDIFDEGRCVSGATVNEDGTVSLILDIAAILDEVSTETMNV